MDTYVYGVTSAGELRIAAEGIDGQRVELLEHEGLAALVSDAASVPVKANRRNLIAHAAVLQEVVVSRCVLPMRFGVVMPARDAVADELLDATGGELHARLDALHPYVELDLRAICPEESLLRAAVADDPEIRRLRESLDGRPPEATYYERIRLGELVAQAIARRRDAIARRIDAKLNPLAAASEPSEPLHEEMLANIAFLVDRDRVPQFDHAVERLGSDLAPAVRLRYTGPLPPHHFVDLDAMAGAGRWA